jgi:hypothetical protein
MKIDLKELEALARAATPGPWSTYDASACNGDFSHVEIAGADGTVIVSEDAGPGRNDSYFIAAANPAAMLELIAMASAPARTYDAPAVRCYLMVDGDNYETNGIDQFSGGRTGGTALVAQTDAIAYTAGAVAAERERAARLALQWSNARDPDHGGHALRNYAEALRSGVQVDERDSDYHWSNAPAAQAESAVAALTIKPWRDRIGDDGTYRHSGKLGNGVEYFDCVNCGDDTPIFAADEEIKDLRAALAQHAGSDAALILPPILLMDQDQRRATYERLSKYMGGLSDAIHPTEEQRKKLSVAVRGALSAHQNKKGGAA